MLLYTMQALRLTVYGTDVDSIATPSKVMKYFHFLPLAQSKVKFRSTSCLKNWPMFGERHSVLVFRS